MPTSSPPTTDEHDDFLKLEDAAKDIGCGVRWLRDGVNHHGFPYDRYGKALWFSRQQRAQIRAMNRFVAQPSKLAAARKARAKAARSKPSAAAA